MPALFLNPHVRAGSVDPVVSSILSVADAAAALASITAWPGYQPTRLVDLPGRARAEGIARLAYKDESGRFGLKSFKALGGAYAVERFVADRLGVDRAALLDGSARARSAGLTVSCATDGNHGRSVAWGARLFGCRAVIYVHETVSVGRARAIESFGAEVIRVPGVYEDAVRRCAEESARLGYEVISDTAYPGCMTAPRIVMAGYTVMVAEALDQWGKGAPPSHVFIQAGVGGLAAAVAAGLWHRYGEARPRLVVVEPERAACCFASAVAGEPTPASGDLDTICAGLACGEVSLLAWQVLERAAHAFLTVPDAAVITEMRRLARPEPGDPVVIAGESAPVGLAGLAAAVSDAGLADALKLRRDSTVLLFGSEGDTDPELYQHLIRRGEDQPA